MFGGSIRDIPSDEWDEINDVWGMNGTYQCYWRKHFDGFENLAQVVMATYYKAEVCIFLSFCFSIWGILCISYSHIPMEAPPGQEGFVRQQVIDLWFWLRIPTTMLVVALVMGSVYLYTLFQFYTMARIPPVISPEHACRFENTIFAESYYELSKGNLEDFPLP
eukprot:UN30403